MRNILSVLFVAFFLLMSLFFGAECYAKTLDPGISNDEKEDWNVLLFPRSLNTDGGFPLTMHSVFQILENNLKHAPKHTLSREEQKVIANNLRESRRQELQKELDQVVTTRDQVLFAQEESLYGRYKERRKYRKTIRELREKLEALDGVANDDIDVIQQKTIQLQELDEHSTITQSYEIRNLALEKGFDQVIYAIAEPISEMSIYVTVMEYNAVLDSYAELTEVIATVGDVEETVRRVSPAITRAVLGVDTATLLVTVHSRSGNIEPRAAVYVDGEFSGYGLVEALFLESGQKTIVVDGGDKLIQTKEIVLLPGESREVYFRFDTPDDKGVLISSEPNGARVYVDSLYIGDTPIRVQRSRHAQALNLNLPGYASTWLLIKPLTPETMHVVLETAVLNTQEILDKKRNQFYQSIAFVAFSTPFPMFFSALYQGREHYLQSNSGLSTSAFQENKRLHDIYLGTFWASLGITLAFTGYLLYRLIDYIRYAGVYERKRIAR